MHPIQINDPFINAFLNRMAIGNIYPKVSFSGNARPITGISAGGFPIFGPSPVPVVWDLSGRVIQESIKLSYSKPITPTGIEEGESYISSKLSIRFANSNHEPYIGTSQTGSMMDLGTIETGEISIEVAFEGIGPRLPMFTGRIEGPPKEGLGFTEFVLYDLTIENISTPMIFDNFADVNGNLTAGQYAYSNGNRYIAESYRVSSGVDFFDAHCGAATFAEEGDTRPTITNNSPEQIDLKRINVLNGAKPGLYRIDFYNTDSYKITYPDSKERRGSINTPFLAEGIELPSGAANWTGSDGSGVEIEFKVQCANWIGNPFTMLRVCLERAYLQNYGELPGTNPQFATLPIDWAAIQKLEKEYKGFKIYASTTNEDNAKWNMQTGSRPLSYFRFGQMCIAHVGASLTITPSGKVSVIGPRLFDDFIPEISTAEAILSHTLNPPESGRKFNTVNIKYGFNQRSGSYGAEYRIDTRSGPLVQEVPFNISLPWFKAGHSFRAVEWLAGWFVRRYIDNPNTLTMDLPPNYMLVQMPGDRLKVTARTQPKLVGFFEINSISKGVGKSGSVQLFRLQEPEGEAFTLCASVVGAAVV